MLFLPFDGLFALTPNITSQKESNDIVSPLLFLRFALITRLTRSPLNNPYTLHPSLPFAYYHIDRSIVQTFDLQLPEEIPPKGMPNFLASLFFIPAKNASWRLAPSRNFLSSLFSPLWHLPCAEHTPFYSSLSPLVTYFTFSFSLFSRSATFRNPIIEIIDRCNHLHMGKIWERRFGFGDLLSSRWSRSHAWKNARRRKTKEFYVSSVEFRNTERVNSWVDFDSERILKITILEQQKERSSCFSYVKSNSLFRDYYYKDCIFSKSWNNFSRPSKNFYRVGFPKSFLSPILFFW